VPVALAPKVSDTPTVTLGEEPRIAERNYFSIDKHFRKMG